MNKELSDKIEHITDTENAVHELELRWLVPVHDRILLILFRDISLGVWDAELVLNDNPRLMLSKNPAMKEPGYIVPKEFSGPISQKIRSSKYTEPKGGELVSIEFDDTAKNELICWCEAHSANSANGITPQKLIHAFCRFAIEAENLSAIKEWILEVRQQ